MAQPWNAGVGPLERLARWREFSPVIRAVYRLERVASGFVVGLAWDAPPSGVGSLTAHGRTELDAAAQALKAFDLLHPPEVE